MAIPSSVLRSAQSRSMPHSAPTVSLFLLGPPRIERAGAVPALKYNRARALLAFLALEPGFHTRDSLADLLWPQEPTSQGRDKLKRMLFELREALGDHCIEGDRHVVRLAPLSTVWVDALAFEADTDPVLPAPPPAAGFEADSVGSGWREALDRCARAVDLYRGPLLQGLKIDDAPDFESWLDGQREAYVRRLVLALSRLARGRAQDGRYADALRHARRLVDIAPHHEPGWQLLIDLLMQLGRRDEALHELDRCRRALARELDAEPQAATLALFEGKEVAEIPTLSITSARPSLPGGIARSGAEHAESQTGSSARHVPAAFSASARGEPSSETAKKPVATGTSDLSVAVSVPRAHARLAMGIAHLLRDRLTHAARAFEGTLLAQPDEVIDLSLGTDARATAMTLLALTNWRSGQHAEARETAEHAVGRARRVGDPRTLAHALLGAGVLCQLHADSERTLDYTAEILDIAEHNAMPTWALAATALSGWAMATLGDAEGIEAAESAARELAARMGTIETLFLSLLRRKTP